jgi:arylsulfatase A
MCSAARILASAAWVALLSAVSVVAADRPPNIVYIMVDDAGYGDFSCYGQTKFSTPHIDRLATEGLRFTQHYSGSTVCAPTRCSLMTGRHTGRISVRGNREHQPVGQMPMAADEITVAQLLKQAGYVTGAFGKWGLGYPGSVGDPLNKGFDVFFGYNCQRNAHTFYPTWLYDNAQQIALDGKTYSHDLIVQRALKFLRENKDGPFFCYLPFTIPHAAMHVPDEYAAPYRELWPQFNDRIGRYARTEVRNPIAAFAGMMVKLDESVGQVMALLEELGIDEHTVVMFTSDNGPHREGGHDPDFFDSNGPLTGYKRDLTEGGIRVPLIVRWPGTVPAGVESHLISAHWDFLPTACAIAGIEPPDDIDGISMLPTLLGKAEQQKLHEYLYWEFFEQGGKRAARMGKWKAIQLNLHNDADSPIRLYDLDADLAEQHDLAAEHPALVARFRKIFAEAHEPSQTWRFKSSIKTASGSHAN